MVIGNKPYTVNEDHINYEAIIYEIRGDQDPDVLLNLIDVARTIQNYFEQETNELVVDLDAGRITFNGKEVHSLLVTKIVEMYRQGFNVNPMVNFMANLYQNPSERAIDELYGFLEYGKLPITSDGCFLAYKKVNNDYTSVHDRTFKNDIGTIVSMPREDVDDNSSRTCSSGLHLCSHEYLSNYSGDKVLILKVNPRDIVSIPTDYNNTKARACQYEIIGELGQPNIKAAVTEKKPVLPELVADLSDYELQPPVKDQQYSSFFQAAYSIGYYTGRNKGIQDKEIVEEGDTVVIADDNEWILSYKQALDINKGYDLGYIDGKRHNKRLVPKMEYTDITVECAADTY
ncbi:MAG: hypothetical protein EO766_12300 [Hydrotalea sp. AMD]|uniref:hypothetical protein n=1 Tax=Hydrotalea sp. AMD TaxID=2501297 RepID=UPI0010261509|nr:hypothetical protein [Hydrotalea sp. AMD]RWZ87299.1 MAG: hypothetical protein EO766_12300 [Hydrotalea sp. AMD]